MQLKKDFHVDRSREQVLAVLDRDETLVGLFPNTETEIVEKKGDRKTTRSHYRALGHEGVSTFHFTFLVDGNLRFEKVCDGRVWRELRGEVTIDEEGAGTHVTIEMKGRTKPLVPEFTIKAPMHDQLDQMAMALRQRVEEA